jgi:hypothetical protein
MNFDPLTNTISVHGRESLDLPYSKWTSGETTTQVDISASIMFLEIPSANIRTQLLTNDADAKGLKIYLSRDEVAYLPTVPSPYVIINETVTDQPMIEVEGKIYRTGYTTEPTLVAPPS